MTFNSKTFNKLSDIFTTGEACVSIYIPTHRAGNVQEDKIRFKNALTEAVNKLIDANMLLKEEMDKKSARKFLSPAFELLEDHDFWMHLSDGLAVFINEDIFEYFIVPLNFNKQIHVGSRFYLRHMLPLLTGEDRFFLLALSQGDVRFFEGHKHHITPVIIKDLVPENKDAVMQIAREPVLQAHTAGAATAIYHGQGVGYDTQSEDLKQYFRQIDRGLMEMLYDERTPMIIAAVDYLVPIYKEISKYPHIVDAHVSGNPDDEDPVMLHEKAWSIMQPYFNSKRQYKKKQFEQFMSMEKASNSLTEVVAAAQEGKIDTLFVDQNTDFIWGFHKHLTDNTVKMQEKQNEYNTCLLDYAAMHTWQNGGTVYNIPREQFADQDSAVNAIYRY